MAVDQEKLVGLYTRMLLIRRFEERLLALQKAGELLSSPHTCIGQEAMAVGVCSNLRTNDYIISNHRGHGHLIAKGGDIKRILAEALGKKTGYCKGKGGMLHLANVELGYLASCGIVGGGLPLANGPALASKLRGTDQVTVCFFGDGAACEGTFHEALNLASIWKLPVIFVCENNMYAMTTPASYGISVKDVASRAAGYNMPGVVVDGQDLQAVSDTISEAIALARRGGGPSLIEGKTYRYMAHSGSDEFLAKGGYRTREEIEEWRRKDPVVNLEAMLIEMGALTKADATRIDDGVKAQIDEAVAYSRQSPLPAPEEALEDLFV